MNTIQICFWFDIFTFPIFELEPGIFFFCSPYKLVNPDIYMCINSKKKKNQKSILLKDQLADLNDPCADQVKKTNIIIVHLDQPIVC